MEWGLSITAGSLREGGGMQEVGMEKFVGGQG